MTIFIVSLLSQTLLTIAEIVPALPLQINCRYINEEPNVLKGLFDNQLFVAIAGGELLLQVIVFPLAAQKDSSSPISFESPFIQLLVTS